MKPRKKPQIRSQNWKIALALLAFAGLAGCGKTIQDPVASQTPPAGGGNTGGTGGGSGGGTLPPTGSAPPYTFSFDVLSYDGVWDSPVITGADSILVVSIQPSSRIRIDNSGYDLSYGCGQFEVEVAGETRTTPLIRPQGSTSSMCPGQGSSARTDFSNRLGGGGSLRIRVKHARTDFLCQNYYSWVPGNPETFACPVHAAYTTHHITGNLCVQVNGTTSCPN